MKKGSRLDKTVVYLIARDVRRWIRTVRRSVRVLSYGNLMYGALDDVLTVFREYTVGVAYPT